MRDFFIQFGVDIIKFSTSAAIALLFVIYMVLEKEPPPTTRTILQYAAGALISVILVPLTTIEILGIESNAKVAILTGLVVYSFPKIITLASSILLSKIKDKGGNGSN